MDSSQSLSDILTRSGGDITDAFFASVFLLMALIATGFTISSGLRLRGEESQGHAEMLLSTPVARVRWAAGHLLDGHGRFGGRPVRDGPRRRAGVRPLRAADD